MKINIMIHANWKKTPRNCVDAEILEIALFHFFLGAQGNKEYGLSVDVGSSARSKYEEKFPVTSSVTADGSALKSPEIGFALADRVEAALEMFERDCALPLTLIKEEELEDV